MTSRQRIIPNNIPTTDDVSKDTLFTCPYNKYHRITALKYPGHLALCRKQYTGTSYKRCPFNARHEIPDVEYDYHISTCPDKKLLEKEISSTPAPNVMPVNHFPDWKQIEPTEDWDSEATNTGFSISGLIDMEPERNAYDVMEDFHDQLEERACQPEQYEPAYNGNMSSSPTKAHKKNMKRAANRRKKRLGEEDDGDDEEEPIEHVMSVQEKENKLREIAREYSAPGRKYSDAFVDWVSILNIYCQKNRINQPKYSEASNPHGGFGSSVVVSSERFYSEQYCSTKKEAKHSAARAALLGLKIAVGMPDPCRAPHVGATNLDRARELEQRKALIESTMTTAPRVIPGLNPAPAQQSSSQAVAQQQNKVQQVTSQMARVNLEKQNEDEWQVAGARRKDGNKNLRLAGIGRGRARKRSDN